MNLFLSPHNDDEALFGALIIQKFKPLVLVVTDSFIQPERGETQCSKNARRAESEAACKILGAPVQFLGIPDKDFNRVTLVRELSDWAFNHGPFETVFAPAVEERGNWMHNVIGEYVDELFPCVKHYFTYTASRLYPEGPVKVESSEAEFMTKLRALECYKSQMTNVCKEFFTQTFKDEYLDVA